MTLWSRERLSALLTLIGISLVPVPVAQAQITSPAAQAILTEFDTGEVLFCQNCDQQMAPSSMSKLMTVEQVFQRLKEGRLSLNDTFHVSENAWRQGQNTNESKMWVEIDSDVSIDDILKGIIVVSGGDACVVVAEALGGDEAGFAELSNNRAAELGLTNSHFVNAHGLAEQGHYMSARDIAILSAHIVRDYPEYYHYFSIPEFTWSDIRQPSRNAIISERTGIDGLKTGHTDLGGYGIVASALRDGRRLIAVVNGLGSIAQRNREVQRLLDIGFREFRSYELVAAGDTVGEAEVWGGAAAKVPLTVAAPFRAVLTPDARRDMVVKLRYDGPVAAPVVAGQEIGSLTVSAPGKPDRAVPLIAAADVAETGIFGKMFLGLLALVTGTVS